MGNILNVELLKNPMNWVIVIAIIVLVWMAFFTVSKSADADAPAATEN